jgi:hypothetical protein
MAVCVIVVGMAVSLSATAAEKGAGPKVESEGTAGSSPPVQGAREVVLDEKSTGKVFAIRAARNVLTTVEFPEDLVGRPACGDCEQDPNPTPEGEALYRMAVSAQGRYVTLRPNPSARRPRDGETGTTVLVRLEHATLTLYVEQVERSRADTRVVFTYPNRSSDTEYLRVERAKIEAEANARVETMFRGRMLRAMQEPHACARKSARTRVEDIVLEVREMCYFGRDVFIVFQIENRGSIPLEVGAVVVSRGQNAHDDLGGGRVEGDEPSVGAVSVRLADGDALKGPYELSIHEKGGKERVISIGRLEF